MNRRERAINTIVVNAIELVRDRRIIGHVENRESFNQWAAELAGARDDVDAYLDSGEGKSFKRFVGECRAEFLRRVGREGGTLSDLHAEIREKLDADADALDADREELKQRADGRAAVSREGEHVVETYSTGGDVVGRCYFDPRTDRLVDVESVEAADETDSQPTPWTYTFDADAPAANGDVEHALSQPGTAAPGYKIDRALRAFEGAEFGFISDVVEWICENGPAALESIDGIGPAYREKLLEALARRGFTFKRREESADAPTADAVQGDAENGEATGRPAPSSAAYRRRTWTLGPGETRRTAPPTADERRRAFGAGVRAAFKLSPSTAGAIRYGLFGAGTGWNELVAENTGRAIGARLRSVGSVELLELGSRLTAGEIVRLATRLEEYAGTLRRDVQHGDTRRPQKDKAAADGLDALADEIREAFNLDGVPPYRPDPRTAGDVHPAALYPAFSRPLFGRRCRVDRAS